MSLDTVELPGIELMSTGGPFHGSGSPEGGDFYDEGDLRAIAEANNALAEEIHPPLKIGHGRGQQLLRNSGLAPDELPAAGWLANFRVSGGKLIADLKGVPRKLAQVIPHGYRNRSVELSR